MWVLRTKDFMYIICSSRCRTIVNYSWNYKRYPLMHHNVKLDAFLQTAFSCFPQMNNIQNAYQWKSSWLVGLINFLKLHAIVVFSMSYSLFEQCFMHSNEIGTTQSLVFLFLFLPSSVPVQSKSSPDGTEINFKFIFYHPPPPTRESRDAAWKSPYMHGQ